MTVSSLKFKFGWELEHKCIHCNLVFSVKTKCLAWKDSLLVITTVDVTVIEKSKSITPLFESFSLPFGSS